MELANSKRIKTGELIRERDKLIKEFQINVQTEESCQKLLTELDRLASEAKEVGIDIFTALILKRHMRNTVTIYNMLKNNYTSEKPNSRIELFTTGDDTTVQVTFEDNKPKSVQYAYMNKNREV